MDSPEKWRQKGVQKNEQGLNQKVFLLMVQTSSFQEEQNKVASKQKPTDSTTKYLTLNFFLNNKAALFH